jgi:hypothetical protein
MLPRRWENAPRNDRKISGVAGERAPKGAVEAMGCSPALQLHAICLANRAGLLAPSGSRPERGVSVAALSVTK